MPQHAEWLHDVPAYLRSLEEGLARSIERLYRNPNRFSSALSTAMTCVHAHLKADPTAASDRTWEAAKIALQIASAGFRAATLSPGETTECRIGQEVRELPAARLVPDAHPANWLTGFWLAVIARDQRRMTQFAEVPVEILRRDNGVRFDELFFHWVEALQAFWATNPAMWEKLSAATETCRPERARNTDEEILGAMYTPVIAMFDRFVRKDRDGFVQALRRALQAHQQYWTKNDDRAVSLSGNLALGALAMACMACDLGWSIEVESDYLPAYFLRPAEAGTSLS
ncbi:immunity 49 family protein [Nocardia fusca]|uniref:immunity 49 family protein n=1 Tax=Nocardia fusca TaxID=941183 RepID=UPI00378923E4